MAHVSVIVTTCIFLQLIAGSNVFSQQADTAFVALAQKKNSDSYTRAIELQSRLYNGHDYVYYISKDDEHPYYNIDDWTFGSVVYGGELYENVAILYDLTTDQIITENRSGATIRLNAEKIESFRLGDHIFVRLRPDHKNGISEGFYHQLYIGNLKVYAKYVKQYEEVLTNREVVPDFTQTTRYYVVKDGVFYNVKTKSGVLKVLEDRKQELRNLIRKNRIDFRSNKAAALVQISEHYDSLKE
jgi:asparagine N-glycosylation enzyme membrane subunit Stt3